MSEYVTNESWCSAHGRPDTIDDIADQFERRPVPPVQPVRRAEAEARVAARWPRSGGGWRSVGRLHPRSVERSTGG